MSREMKDSGVEWIGEIPEDWDVKRIKHAVVQMGSGTTPNSDNSNFYDGNIAWIQSGDLYNTPIITKTSKTVTEQAIQRCSALKIYHKPYIVIAMYGASVGNVSIASIDACTNQACCIIKPNDNNNIDYLKYWLEVCKTDFIRKSVGGGQPNISQDKVREQTYLCPSPTEQQQIVHFLDRKCTAIDTAIEKTKKSIEKLEEYKKAVITKAVTKGIDPNAKMKDSGVEWIGEMPEGWEITRNKFYVIISHGMDPKTEGDIPVYGSGAESFKSCGEYKEGPAVLLGRKGATLHIPHYITGKYWNVDTAFDVKTKSEDMGLKYFYFLSMCFNYNYYIAKTTLPSMTQFDYCNMRIPLPSRKEQDIIVSYIEDKCVAIDTAIEKKKKAIEKWEEYKKSLIYYAVTGKIDCRNEVI